ncbi:PhnD/SsuA/transferrin family substrate-binding protein [Shewanella sp. GXUN23E]|uniref:PhnD/SsuA/transferrin family substrate-binding protein n=1 Tax=Shewanella sp. GXUN23E TaxID=3422498 RepID=UPI003D7C9479
MTRLIDFRASHRTIVVFMLLFAAMSLGWGLWQGHQVDLSGQSLVKLSERCSVADALNHDAFVVYIPDEQLADVLLTKLCSNTVIAKQFGAVEVVWGYKVSDALEFLGKGLADLVLTNDNIMQALMGEPTHNYHAILQYPAYSAYLIANKEKPRLEKAYFIDKSLGLLSSPTSRSGHILPKRLLNSLGLNLDTLDIRYASSHAELRTLLASGDVDIISTFWEEQDNQRFSRNYTTRIREEISGGRWYIKLSQQNTDLVCSLQHELTGLSQALSGYYRDIQPVGDCQLQVGL